MGHLGSLGTFRTIMTNYSAAKKNRPSKPQKWTDLKQILSLFFAAWVGCLIATAQVTRDSVATQSLIIVVSLDGFPARAIQDPRLPIPTLRALAAKGAVAAGMQPINPTVTWPNHTALVTGVDASRHHVMANGLIAFPADGGVPQVEPWVDKAKLVHAATLYEAAAQKGLVTAQVDWVAIYGAAGISWAFEEKPDPDGPIAKELIAQGSVTRDQLAAFNEGSSPAWRDQVWTDAAVDILQKHSPNLVLLHLLDTDTLQHQYAPLTSASYTAYAYADACLARIVEAVRAAGRLQHTTFFIVSDHGFSTVTNTIRPNAGLVQLGLLKKEDNAYHGSVWVKAEGGAASVYIRDASTRATLAPRLKTYFASFPGVEHVYTNQEARDLGLPGEEETDQAPQLYLVAKQGYAFEDAAAGALESDHPPRGQHGFPSTSPDMQALFVASGEHIRPGVKLGSIPNLNVAPTIAALLGLTMKDMQGRPLSEILQ